MPKIAWSGGHQPSRVETIGGIYKNSILLVPHNPSQPECKCFSALLEKCVDPTEWGGGLVSIALTGLKIKTAE